MKKHGSIYRGTFTFVGLGTDANFVVAQVVK